MGWNYIEAAVIMLFLIVVLQQILKSIIPDTPPEVTFHYHRQQLVRDVLVQEGMIDEEASFESVDEHDFIAEIYIDADTPDWRKLVSLDEEAYTSIPGHRDTDHLIRLEMNGGADLIRYEDALHDMPKTFSMGENDRKLRFRKAAALYSEL